MSEQSKTPRAFEYLLNAMENASHHTNPAEHSYGERRNAVFQHVSQLETDLADARAALREVVWRDREQFPNDPYCVICGAGKAWAEKHGHQETCVLAKQG